MTVPTGAAASTQRLESLDYARRLYSNVLQWYDNADRKGQLVLTVDGIFLTILSSTLTTKARDIGQIATEFEAVTWGALCVMLLAVIGSLYSAVMCLVSRHSETKGKHHEGLSQLLADVVSSPARGRRRGRDDNLVLWHDHRAQAARISRDRAPRNRRPRTGGAVEPNLGPRPQRRA
jgi:hypothetical protein